MTLVDPGASSEPYCLELQARYTELLGRCPK